MAFSRGNPGLSLLTGGWLSGSGDWYSIPIALVQVWAALEVLAVSDRRRWVASAWAVLALLVVALDYFPDVRSLLRGAGQDDLFGWGAILLHSVPPAATLLLINRKLIPQAVALSKD